MKKIFTLVSIVVFCFCLIPMNALGENSEEQAAWTCAGCEQENTGSFCVECGMSKTESDIKAKFEIEVVFGVHPKETFVEGEKQYPVWTPNASKPFYIADCEKDCFVFPVVYVKNKTDSEQAPKIKFICGEERSTWENETIAPFKKKGCRINKYLTVGSYEYLVYIDDVKVAEGTYVVAEGHSDVYSFIPKLRYSMDLIIYDYSEQNVAHEYFTDFASTNDLDEHQELQPRLKVYNDNILAVSIEIGCQINGYEGTPWPSVTILGQDSHRFRYDECPFVEGENKLVWYINGKKVYEDTCEVYFSDISWLKDD